MKRFVEACCTDSATARKAVEAGFGRIELCERLETGGLTPSRDLLEEVLSFSTIPVNVLVRPRAGDFIYSQAEVSLMASSIRAAAKAGASGVVIGALDRRGDMDRENMERLVAEAREAGLSVTFHRAFDVCREPLELLEDVISLGIDRLLTSGHAPTAPQGAPLIARLVRQARGRIVIMAGSGVRPGNIAELERLCGAPEYHSSYISEELLRRVE